MTRTKKKWHSNFIKYMEYIVKHKNYQGIPEPYKEDGSIKWVVSGKSQLGKERTKWWDKKIKELNVTSRADVARAMHPKELKGLKPCQICGKELSIFRVYPTKNTLKRLYTVSKLKFKPYNYTMEEIFEIIRAKKGNSVFDVFQAVFNIPESINKDKSSFLLYMTTNCQSSLSPGVMSNAPDRFEGFHTYNNCCRSKEDTGRHKDNLARYTQERRAYENWAEGNWNLANRLMGEFNRFNRKVICPECKKREKMSADHIGPISLGFTHRPKFKPLCNTCNSKKNNRITLKDIASLIEDEKQGEQVISWHSKYVWEALKYRIKTKADTSKLKQILRGHLNNVLLLFARIHTGGYDSFLKSYLHPEYSFKDYRFKYFDPLDLTKLKITEKYLNSKNKQKNKERYIRISFESLKKYATKDNRNAKNILTNPNIAALIEVILTLLKQKREPEARRALEDTIKALSFEAVKQF